MEVLGQVGGQGLTLMPSCRGSSSGMARRPAVEVGETAAERKRRRHQTHTAEAYNSNGFASAVLELAKGQGSSVSRRVKP